MQLRQPEHEHERRDEDDPAADAEEPGEHAAERGRSATTSDDRHTSSRTPTAASSEREPVARACCTGIRCCSAVPTTTPNDRRDADERGRAGLDLAVQRVGDRAGDRRDEDRGERRRRRARRWSNAEQRGRAAARSRSRRRRRRARRRSRRRGRSRRSFSAPRPTLRGWIALALLAVASPTAAALFLDVDGVLAPIVDRPEDASRPATTRAELARLAGRYALVAVRHRPAERRRARDRRRRRARATPASTASSSTRAPRLGRARSTRSPRDAAVARHRAEAAAASRSTTGPRPDPEAARGAARAGRGGGARAQGLRTRWGRMVLEVLPPVDASKGTAVRHAARRDAGCAARSTPATTRPTSTASRRSTASRSRCASRSPRRRARRSSASGPTSSSARPTRSSSCCAAVAALEPEPLAQLARLAARDVELGPLRVGELQPEPVRARRGARRRPSRG